MNCPLRVVVIHFVLFRIELIDVGMLVDGADHAMPLVASSMLLPENAESEIKVNLEKRLQKRFVKLVKAHMKVANRTAHGPRALPECGEAATACQAAWRFLNNERVTLQALAEPLLLIHSFPAPSTSLHLGSVPEARSNVRAQATDNDRRLSTRLRCCGVSTDALLACRTTLRRRAPVLSSGALSPHYAQTRGWRVRAHDRPRAQRSVHRDNPLPFFRPYR